MKRAIWNWANTWAKLGVRMVRTKQVRPREEVRLGVEGLEPRLVMAADVWVQTVLAEANESGIPAAVQVYRDTTQGDLTLNYTLSGTATATTDYTALPGTVTIPDGLDQVTILIEPVFDAVPEGIETITLTLDNSESYSFAGPVSATVEISDPISDGDIDLGLSSQISDVQIAVAEDGSAVAVWSSGNEVYAQRFGDTGASLGSSFQVNTYTNNDQVSPAVGVAADGAFIVTWQSQDQDGHRTGVYAQRYNASGIAIGGEFRVNTHTNREQQLPTIAVASDGSFLIAWESWTQDG
jgi:hypothetical protein